MATTYPTRPGCELGIDVSRWQGKPPWGALREAGVTWVIAKASEGARYVDPTFASAALEARGESLAFGAYHFFAPAADPKAQAKAFADVAESCTNLLPALDFETLQGCKVRQAVASARVWVEETSQRFGCRPLFYSYPGFILQLVTGIRDREGKVVDPGDPDGMRAIAEACDLWVSHFTKAPEPIVPKPWTKWAAWQFDGDNGLTMPNGMDADFNWCQDLRAISRWPGQTDDLAVIVPPELSRLGG